MLTNLLGNAVKFTARGEVALEVSLKSTSTEAARILFTIRDTGIGIDEQAIPRMFQVFSQADESMSRRFGGTGLGLAICKQLVELMGGQLTVESTLGKGTTFRCEIPFEPARPLPYRPCTRRRIRWPADACWSSTTTRRTVVFLNISSRRSASTAHFAATGTEALAAMRTAAAQGEAFEAAVLDMKLPDISGLDLAQAVKADAALATIRLLMLTSQDVNAGNSTREAGIDVCLHKPVRQNELATALAGLFEASPDVAAEVPQPATPARTGRVLLAEDNAVNRAVASAMIKSSGYTLRVAENGLLALQAFAEERFDVVLMDCQMPEMDGYTATAAIREREARNPDGPRVPIIALTANTMQGDRDRCLAAGFDDYLAKPFKQKDLLAMIELWNTTGAAARPIADCAPADTLVDGAAADGEPQEAAALAPMAGNTPSNAPLDLSVLEEIRSLDPSGSSKFLEEMIGLYLSDGRAQLKAIGLCIADVDRGRAARRGARVEVRER